MVSGFGGTEKKIWKQDKEQIRENDWRDEKEQWVRVEARRATEI